MKAAQQFGSGWHIREESFAPAQTAHAESIFALGNGSLGFRGNFEEGLPGAGVEGVYLNGFYESAPIQYGEIAYGYAENSQTMLNLANPKRIRLFLDGEAFHLGHGALESYERVLSLQEGTLTRRLVWRSPAGRRIRLEVTRFVSLAGQDAAFIQYAVTPLAGCGTLRIQSGIDANVRNLADSSDPRVGSAIGANSLQTVLADATDNACLLAQRTQNSQLAYACAVRHQLQAACAVAAAPVENEGEVGCQYTLAAPEGQTVVLTKYIAFAHGRAGDEDALAASACALAQSAEKAGWQAALAAHTAALMAFWQAARLSITSDDSLLLGLRFNMFHLFGAVGRGGETNIAAKGLTGEGYEGHYFWDTETYIFPFFLHTMPHIARSLLLYRYSILPAARRRARQLSHPTGALFPWRTIGGEECSAYYPAGTAQYHINADVACAVANYADVTGDEEFMRDYGLEMLVETARLWLELGFYSEEKGGAFCINCVTGPDEYNVLVNNNCYTNLMARHNLRMAAHWAEAVQARWPEAAEALFRRIGYAPAEADAWRAAAGAMYIPYSEDEGVFLQDDGFLQRQPWPLESIPKENFPLLLHYHPLVIYRHQVCKQADLVLALLLRGEAFTPEEKRRCFDFYEPLTTHDSSLSRAVFGIVASEVGLHEKAYAFFESTALLDLQDSHGNTKDGLHMANMAGSWLGVAYGFAGMRTNGSRLAFAPTLPKGWRQYSLCVRYRGRLIEVSVSPAATTYSLLEGDEITIYHCGTPVPLRTAHPAQGATA